MRFAIQSVALAMLCISTLFAQSADVTDTKDVPTVATEEMQRRGADVEELGTIQAGPEAGVRRAMAPPADDSDKWFVNFIGAGSTSTDQEKAATKILLDDIKAGKFSQYVKPDDPANSWAHWQEYRIDDALQQDWFAAAKPQLKQVGLPAVIIQPPANGKFGPNKTIVCVIGKYDGRPSHFAELARVRIEAYVHKHGYDGTLATAKLVPSHHGQSANEPIGAKPPFDLPEPIAYPDAKDLPKLTLNFEQIRKKFPEVAPEDAAVYAENQMTEQEIRDEEAKHAEVHKTTENPTSRGGEILASVALIILALGGVWIYQQRQNRLAETVKPSESKTSPTG